MLRPQRRAPGAHLGGGAGLHQVDRRAGALIVRACGLLASISHACPSRARRLQPSETKPSTDLPVTDREVTAVPPFSKGVTEAAARGWDPIFPRDFLMPAWVKSHWPKYAEVANTCERGRPVDTASGASPRACSWPRIRQPAQGLCHVDRQPLRLLLSPVVHEAEACSGRLELFKTRRDQPDAEVTLESICDKLIIYGTPDSVADQSGARLPAKRSAPSRPCSMPAKTGRIARQ